MEKKIRIVTADNHPVLRADTGTSPCDIVTHPPFPVRIELSAHELLVFAALQPPSHCR